MLQVANGSEEMANNNLETNFKVSKIGLQGLHATILANGSQKATGKYNLDHSEAK